MAIPVTVVYRVVKGTALPSLKGMDKTTFAAYVNGTLGDDDSDFCITRTQIQIVGFAIAVTATHLEVGFQLVSWVTNRTQGLAAETIGTGLIFVGVTMLIIGWPVASQKDVGMKFIVSCTPPFSFFIFIASGPRLSVSQVPFGILTSEIGLGARLLQCSCSCNRMFRLLEDKHPTFRDSASSGYLSRSHVHPLIHDQDHRQQRLGVKRPKPS